MITGTEHVYFWLDEQNALRSERRPVIAWRISFCGPNREDASTTPIVFGFNANGSGEPFDPAYLVSRAGLWVSLHDQDDTFVDTSEVEKDARARIETLRRIRAEKK